MNAILINFFWLFKPVVLNLNHFFISFFYFINILYHNFFKKSSYRDFKIRIIIRIGRIKGSNTAKKTIPQIAPINIIKNKIAKSSNIR